jgi:LysR family transcriptional regulator for metE and metH
VEVRIVAEVTRRPLQALLEGKLDLAITSTKIRNQKIRYRPIFKDEFIIVVHPDHPLARQSFIRAEDFANEHLITYQAPKEDLTVFQEVLVPAGVQPREHSQIQLTEAIFEMVKAGLGIAPMAKWAAAPHLEQGTLKAVRLTRKGFKRTWNAALIRNKSVPGFIEDFVKLLARNP